MEHQRVRTGRRRKSLISLPQDQEFNRVHQEFKLLQTQSGQIGDFFKNYSTHMSSLGQFNQTVGKCTLRMFPPNHQFGRDAEQIAKAHLDSMAPHTNLTRLQENILVQFRQFILKFQQVEKAITVRNMLRSKYIHYKEKLPLLESQVLLKDNPKLKSQVERNKMKL
jgi:hypothetical protein